MDYYLKAVECFQSGHWDATQILLEKGLQESSASPGPIDISKVHHLLGLVLYLQGHIHASVSHLKKASTLKPCPEHFLNLSIVLNDIGHYKNGETSFNKAQKLQNSSTESFWKEQMRDKHFQTAKSYEQRLLYKEALQEYIKVLDMDKGHIEAQLQIAKLLWQLNKKEAAFAYLRKIIALNPKFCTARLELAKWYFSVKHIPSAVNEWESVLYLDPHNQEAIKALQHIQELSTIDRS